MTANELADELERMIPALPLKALIKSATMLRQQQAEIKELKTIRGNSVLVPSDKLQAMQSEIKALKLRELTDEEIYSEMIKCIDEPEDGHTFRYKDFARAILKKASEK